MGRHLKPSARATRMLMQHRTALYTYILACVRDRHEAEDILQDVSVAVLESIRQLAEDAGFLPWAREIARRRVLAHFRQAGREKSLEPGLIRSLADAAQRLEQQRPANAYREALTACLDDLPSGSRRILATRYGDGGSLDGLAKALRRSVQGLYTSIKRLKATLRACVERRLATEPR